MIQTLPVSEKLFLPRTGQTDILVKRKDSHDYDEIYIKDYLVKFLLTRLYGSRQSRFKYAQLLNVIDAYSHEYLTKESKLASNVIENACLNIGLGEPLTQLEEDINAVVEDEQLISAGMNDSTALFEGLIRKFIVGTLGDDLRIPDFRDGIQSGGYYKWIKPVSDYNENLFLEKLGKQTSKNPDEALKLIFNNLIKEKLNAIFANTV